MKKLYLFPNAITAFGLACGLFVIFKINMVELGSGYFEVINTSALLLLVAAFADFVDGAVARAFKAESDFGLVFDSLADAISFGVAPSVLLLKTLSLEQGTIFSFLAATGAMIFSLCGILRLVRFTVKAIFAKGNEEELAAQKKHFTGLPIPAAAAAAVSANLVFLAPFFHLVDVRQDIKVYVLTGAMVSIAYLMVCRIKFPSLKALHFRVDSFYLALLTVIVAIAMLYGILHFFAAVIAILSWGYIALALILAIIRKIAGKKSKTLEEFEPADEDEEDSSE